jgi:hypothetical protein
MKTIVLFLALSSVSIEGLFLQGRRIPVPNSNANPLQPIQGSKRKVIPKYILQLYQENLKLGKNVNSLYCIFPSKFANLYSINFFLR